LAELQQDDDLRLFHSAPVALADGGVLVTLRHLYVVVDRDGHLSQQVNDELGMDGEWFAPNITQDGHLITTSDIGRVAVRRGESWEEVGWFGYDIVPPAVYDDGSLAVSGYFGSGLCRVALDGKIRWQHKFDVDLTPSINSQQVVVAGSLNDGKSLFVAPDGEKLGEYGAAAVFAEHLDGAWLARSEQGIARVTSGGMAIWTCAVDTPEHWSSMQPIVDKNGYIYVAAAGSVICYDADGTLIFTHNADGGQPLALSPIGQHEMAYIASDECVIVG
jgi:outer membrane protein assembly factor BamB